MNRQRTKAICGHLGVIGFSFILSFVIFTHADLFSPGGEAIDAAAFGILLTHIFALVVSLFIPRLSFVSCVIVFSISFSLPAVMGIENYQRWHYRRYQAVYDRFRDNLVSPIPASVTNLRFVKLEEQIRPDLAFRFDIDVDDLDELFKRLQLVKVAPKDMLDPKDPFQRPYYMPLEGEWEVFQGKDRYDEVLTIKTNKAHTHAIFR